MLEYTGGGGWSTVCDVRLEVPVRERARRVMEHQRQVQCRSRRVVFARAQSGDVDRGRQVRLEGHGRAVPDGVLEVDAARAVAGEGRLGRWGLAEPQREEARARGGGAWGDVVEVEAEAQVVVETRPREETLLRGERLVAAGEGTVARRGTQEADVPGGGAVGGGDCCGHCGGGGVVMVGDVVE